MKTQLLFPVLVLVAVMCAFPSTGGAADSSRIGGKALFVVAFEGFRDEELMYPMRALKRRGVEVTVASTRTGDAQGMRGTKIPVSVTLDGIDAKPYDAVVFVGGIGCRRELWDNEHAQELARQAFKGRQVLGAICYAPCILVKAGLLEGRTAAVYADQHSRKVFKAGSVRVSSDHVVIDGMVVTADGPASAQSFASGLVKVLMDQKRDRR